MVKTISDPTSGCCESATESPLQRRRFVHFVVFIVLGAICVGLLAAFGTHVDSIESKHERDKWNRWLPAIYGPMCIFLLLAIVFCVLTFCCGGKIQVPESPVTRGNSPRSDSTAEKVAIWPPTSGIPPPPAPVVYHVYHHPDDYSQALYVYQPGGGYHPDAPPPAHYFYQPGGVSIGPHGPAVQPNPRFLVPYQSQQQAVFSPHSARKAHGSAGV